MIAAGCVLYDSEVLRPPPVVPLAGELKTCAVRSILSACQLTYDVSRIFISHSHVDNAAALAISRWLRDHGWDDHYLDIDIDRGNAPGERWLAALMRGVERCEAVLFLVTPAWCRSKYCFLEFAKAKELGKRIFGVVLSPVEPSDLPAQMDSEWQMCDLSHEADPELFQVERAPIVPLTYVRFPRVGLKLLERGLRLAGLDALSFAWPPSGHPGRLPFPGLTAFDEPDAAVFFGRDAAIIRAMDQLRQVRERGVERLFVVLGASGAGKSSFLRAGLVPRLRRDSDHFVVLPTLRCEGAALSGAQGLIASLQAAMRAVGLDVTMTQLRARLERDGLANILRSIDAADAPQRPDRVPAKRTVVVPIDQFEELFAAGGGPEATDLLGMLEELSALKSPTLQVLVLVTMRSDALPLLENQPRLRSLAPFLSSLPSLRVAEFKAVVEGPARRHSESVLPLTVDPALTEELIADAQGADALPLLALTLALMYRESGQARAVHLGLADYHALGGARGVVKQAVARALEHPNAPPAIPALQSEQEDLLRSLFPLLATVDPETAQPKRRVALRDVVRKHLVGADALVTRLVEQRLLVADRRSLFQAGSACDVVEIAHEALLRQWPLLEAWLQKRTNDLAAFESIRRETRAWQREGRQDDLLLLKGDRLNRAERLMAKTELEVKSKVDLSFESDIEEYVTACRRRDAQETHERTGRLGRMREESLAILRKDATTNLDDQGSRPGADLMWLATREFYAPLNAILGFSDFLREGMLGPLSARQRDTVDHIHTAGIRLLNQINDIREVSRVETYGARLDVAQFSISETVEQVLVVAQNLCAQKEQELRAKLPAEGDVWIAVAKDVKKVLENLLNNAIKFTPVGGSIELRAGIDPRSEGLWFEVEDNGIGIAAEDHASVIEEFRPTGVGARAPRIGLGLTLVRKLVELHGGRVSLRSSLGAGACFRVNFPAPAP